jgi:hypothetical protein
MYLSQVYIILFLFGMLLLGLVLFSLKRHMDIDKFALDGVSQNR